MSSSFSRNVGSALHTLAFALACSTAFARLPEPDGVWWGTMTHNAGQVLTSNGGSPIMVVAKYNGVIVAENSVPSGSGVYVLKVPLDDGVEPRVPGTVRAGERVRIFLKNTATNVEYEALETRTGPTVHGTVAPTRGTVYPLSLSIPENLSTGGALAAGFGIWKQGFPAIPSSASANLDSDGDGMTDFQEFLSDTDPTNGADSLRILQMERVPGVISIRFGPVRLGRIYSVYCTPSLTNPTWSKVGVATPSAAAASRWFDHASHEPAGFYRVEVGIQ